MRLIQHKREAWWFYRYLSPLYDRWVNPLFWTPAMRARALELARLDGRDLRTLDVGAGTGFATEGIVEHVDAGSVTMLDQSPHQLDRARRKRALAACRAVLGDAERLPFDTDEFDRWVSCGSVEYWPDPQRAVAEAYRVLRPGGVAVLVGPLPPRGRLARALADAWMLFPGEDEYRGWFERAGFADVELRALAAPWQPEDEPAYAVAVAGRKPAPGAPALALEPLRESLAEPLTPARAARLALRFAAGSLAGAAFVPVGLVLNVRARRRARTG